MKGEDQYAIENKPSFSGCFQWFCADVFSPKIKRGVLSGVDLHSDGHQPLMYFVFWFKCTLMSQFRGR
jgi:hypothetical protein